VTLLFVGAPLAGLVLAISWFWGRGVGLRELGIATAMYFLTGFGITIGYHRMLTHRAFETYRPLKYAFAVFGSMAVQGPVIGWVADHRRHHAFTDKEGDPHSPWLFGTTPAAVARGFCHAHFGWMLRPNRTNPARFAPDLLADPDIARINRQFPFWTAVSLVAPALLGGLLSWSWWGAATAFFWAGLVRIGVQHHVTWSVNSICHMVGDRPWTDKDRSTNFWPLAIVSLGESWHNLHHADPTCARHGVGRGQIDISARIIAILERLGWAYDIRWPTPQRLARLAASRDRQS